MHHRIEKSGFHAGEYVGYCDGPWRIRKRADGVWRADKSDGRDSVSARTLDGIGDALEQRATRYSARAMFA